MRFSPFSITSLVFLLLELILSPVLAGTKKFTTLDNHTYAYDYVPARGTQSTVLLIHGFPVGRNVWRHQVDNLTAAGYGILAPDCLGYGDTSAPLDVEAYSFKTMAGHFDAILDHEGLESVVGVGHDWGSSLLSSAAVYHPQRFEKLAFLSVPYNPPGPFDLDALNAVSLRQQGYTRYGYWYFFNSFEAPDILNEHLLSFFSLIFPADPSIWRDNLAMLGGAKAWLTVNTTTAPPSYLTQNDIVEWMRRFGTLNAMSAPLNYYRSVMRGVQAADAEAVPGEDLVLRVPILTIVGAQDAIAVPEEMQAATEAWVEGQYTAEVVQGGHWPMLEQAEAVNDLLAEFAAS